MKNQLSIHRYTLHSRGSLNAKSSRQKHHGALVRVEDDKVVGYGCIHPWPELGDVNLERTLELLVAGEYTALSARALQCAAADGVARRDKVSLFAGLPIPRSHASLMMDADDLKRAVEAGFTVVKLKVGRDPAPEIDFIREQAGKYPELKWRLDFNGVLVEQEVERFLAGLGEELRQKIDFIEDAYRLRSTPWVDALGPYDIPMAVDREVADACGDFGVAVIKPALHKPRPILSRAVKEPRRFVFTSYLDHPLGQCFAAWEAGVALRSFPGVVDTCGLVTHGLFEANAFSEALGPPRPDFHAPEGTGLGFDQLLEALPWKPLE